MNELAILILACVTLCVLFALGVHRWSREAVLQRRLEELRVGAGVETTEEELKKPFARRVILPLAETIAQRARTLMPKQAVTATRSRLITAGMYPGMNEMHFLGLCWLMGFVFLFLSVFVTKYLIGLTVPAQLIIAIGAFVAGMFLPKAMLDSAIARRQDEIMVSFPYALDLLAICVEAGLGFDSALGYVMKKSHGPLADEFAKTLNEIRLGKPRMDALVDLGSRIGVEDVRSFITAVVHVNRMGGSIAESLRVQADMVRVKRRHRAQEKVMKAPIKMVFPLVLCILPALFVVILCPALIAIVKEIVGK